MATCKACNEPLMLEVDDEDGNGQQQTVPDDLELSCGDHFHWQCLLDQSSEIAISLKCPACQSQIAANSAGPSVTNPFLHAASGVTILTKYTNEGGVQEDFDILPSITEEAYLEANPEARPARAYHIMCSEGDTEGIVDLLRDAETGESDEPVMATAQLLRYQDPLANNKSGLHLAIEKGHEQVVWLLLWLSSSLPADVFPEPAVAAAQSLGLQRPHTAPMDDIRALQDEHGRTAEAVAVEMDGIWTAMLEAGALHAGA
ncbi:uncharacterized protein BCR38DRAFT_342145 [Pseudomassariella vexata]|uniref:Uncharacterized protein n=1 Tax=Pseudomassariella vexata TaxID=1141098 RepID=A0A1Y2E132_9PEZI|nr:uncharacterized protein BCR38DRAFT_342145 [Pseudomassariella vexata]ORY65248.1 hypothetical protein BCR38DRAFT_342145 [Pseudomassariella vexata]